MLQDLKRELDVLLASSVPREIHAGRERHAGQIDLRGRILSDFTSWDYFNLGSHERVKRVAHEELELSGVGSASSRTNSGSVPAHVLCEERFAKFFGTESALLFSSKNQAVFSTLTAVLGERDVVISEEQLQAPAADAAFLVGASFGTFSHRSLSSLAAELERHRLARRKIVLVESLVSLTGDLTALAPMADLCSKAGAALWVDESAGLGSLGPRGAGGTDREQSLIGSKIACKFSELSSLLGVQNAIVCGPATLVSYVLQRSRAIGIECSPTPAVAAAASVALDLVEVMPGARASLSALAQRLRAGIAALLHSSSDVTDSPVVSIPCVGISKAREIAMGLFSRGVLADVVQTRTLLSELALVRFIVNHAHTEATIDGALGALAEVLKRVDAS
jgi:8-amino-7-oxononanoate synthase